MTTAENVPGIIFRHRLRGGVVGSEVTQTTWSPDGQSLAVCSEGGRIAVWGFTDRPRRRDIVSERGQTIAAWSPGTTLVTAGAGRRIQSWKIGYSPKVQHTTKTDSTCLAWSPDGSILVSGGPEGSIKFWYKDFSESGRVIRTGGLVYQISWHPGGRLLASASRGGLVKVWTWPQRELYAELGDHSGEVSSVTWSPDGRFLASASDDRTIQVWDLAAKTFKILEGHTSRASSVTFSPCGRLLASRGNTDGIRLWRSDTWAPLAVIEAANTTMNRSINFHPKLPLLAAASRTDVHIWAFEPELLLSAATVSEAVPYTTAKVVLVGDSGVGKTGLGWRLAHGEFKEHASTHGQQFWMLDELKTTRADGTECEAVLWDLAGQPDYRLLHALFIDDAALALVLFDPTDRVEPLRGADYWLKALARRPSGPCPVVLVGARTDRGQPTLTEDQLRAFCAERGISGGYLPTSALTGIGLEDLVARMQSHVAWDRMLTTVTTTTFKRIKEFTLSLKEEDQLIVTPRELRQRLEVNDPNWEFSNDELMTAVGHLARHGYVQILRTAAGDHCVLLKPDILNRLASSVVLEARRNPKGLGAVDEARLRGNHYDFPELAGLADSEREILLDAVIVLFLEHNLCFRESVGSQALLIFPELINRKRPPTDGPAMVDDVSYTVQGAVANVYAALVVLLGYTNTFTRTEQWQAQAQYEVGDGDICGFRQTGEREGEIDLVLSYGASTSAPTRLIFQGLFERILLSRQVTVTRYPPLDCPQCRYRQERAEVIRRTEERKEFLFCSDCGAKIVIPLSEDLGLSAEETSIVDAQAATATQRTAYETALAQVSGFTRAWENEPKTVFISYAWGVADHERWVERRLARDLRQAGIDVVLDRWDNAQPGSSIARFVSRITKCDLVVVVGTPLYQEKYENKVSTTGSVVAAEVDLIDQRLLGTNEEKRTVLPVLLAGEDRTSLPPLLMGRVYADFRRDSSYFASVFDLILAIQGIAFDDEAVIELRQSLSRWHVLSIKSLISREFIQE